MNIAMFLVEFKLLNMINKKTSIGTLKNIPAIPQTLPIIDKKTIIIIGLRFNVFPIIFVSKKLPIRIWENVNIIKIMIDSKKLKNWISEKIVGIKIEIKEPTNGIKLRKNAKIPNVGARSLLKKYKIKNVNIPVRKLVKVLIWKYLKTSLFIFFRTFFVVNLLKKNLIFSAKSFSSIIKKII